MKLFIYYFLVGDHFLVHNAICCPFFEVFTIPILIVPWQFLLVPCHFLSQNKDSALAEEYINMPFYASYAGPAEH